MPSLVGRLLNAVSNERSTTILLPYQEDLLEEVKEIMDKQHDIIENFNERIQDFDKTQQIFCQAMELEELRWKYLVQIYLTSRLKKIQSMVGNMVIPIKEKLSEAEANYCAEFAIIYKNALGETELDFTQEEEDLSSFVFFKPLADAGAALLSSNSTNEIVDLKKDQIYFARLEHVKSLLDDEKIVLL